ncbi:MAG: trypsin-like peptidase domain-containing protein [Saprospirales bacterium]|jgi:V8-like Glu-specific endopeptidase|nr:trypsin-like peptidase domain-containing protein [Saprospirales bacterium]MBK8921030.1 trypsin-like peptidase domain-containing protein [Saprospirales bacterium]
MQNAQVIYLNTIEGLLEENELDKALEALLDLDKQTRSGLRQDVIMQSGNYKEASKMFQRGMISFEEFSRISARTRFGLLELMKDLPKRVQRDAQIRNLNTFQFQVPDEARLEKIIGPQNNLLRINWLEKALQASRAVCRVVCADGELGTGFLTKDGYIFTNNHVIPSAEVARDARVEFNYELDSAGRTKSRTAYTLDSGDFITSPPDQLDFTRVRVADNPGNPLSQWGFVEFDPGAVPTIGEAVTIIQHPQGEDKQIALNANEVLSVWNQHVYYTTDTEPGSSGSPVFNKDWKVVAIHHAGKTDAEGGLPVNARGDRRGANRGVLAQQIIQMLGTAGQSSPAQQQPVAPKSSGSSESASGAAPSPAPAAGPGKVVPKFVVIYDVQDTPHCQALNRHLFILKTTKKIEIYNVHEGHLGKDFERIAREQAATADFILVLITPNLFNTETWFNLVMEGMAQGKRIIPIHIEKLDIEGTGLEKLRALPTMNRTVSDFPNTDAAYLDIVAEIKKLLAK